MITNYSHRTKKDDQKLLVTITVCFLFVVWLCTPPGNKFLQMCFWGNNTKMLVLKMRGEDATEYIFHRNNAVYLAKMYPHKSKKAIKEMNMAIYKMPSWLSEDKVQELYRERAYINLYYGDYKRALDDFLKSGEILFNDYLKVALLFKEAGNYKYAINYCNKILEKDNTAYAGYACLSDIYKSVGHPEVALRIWDLAIDRKPNNAKAYVDRAIVKEMLGDKDGYNQDLQKAKEHSPYINIEESIIYSTLHPKVLALTIK